MEQNKYNFLINKYITNINNCFGVDSVEARKFRAICAEATNLHFIQSYYTRLTQLHQQQINQTQLNNTQQQINTNKH